MRGKHRPGVPSSPSRYPLPWPVSPSPSLVFLDHVKIKGKPRKNMLLYIKLERLVLLSFLTRIYLVFWINTVKENLRRRHRPQIENHRSRAWWCPAFRPLVTLPLLPAFPSTIFYSLAHSEWMYCPEGRCKAVISSRMELVIIILYVCIFNL